MRAVVQRVERASVHVEGRPVGEIGTGLLALVAVTHSDDVAVADRLADKLATLRLLAGERSVSDVADAGVLVVSQFTLYGDTRRGRRPSWSAAAPGPVAEPLVDRVAERLRQLGITVATGIFGADMRVELVNDGPFTVVLDLPDR